MSSVSANLLKSPLYFAGVPCLVVGSASSSPEACRDKDAAVVDAISEIDDKLRSAAGAVAAAERRAAEIIAQAERDAASIAAEAARRAEEKALLDLQDHLARQREEAAAEAQEILAGARAQSQIALASVERETIVLALEIARKVVARELEISPDVVLSVAGEALGRIPGGVPGASLRVNPADVEVAVSGRERLRGISGDLRELEVIHQPQVSRGGCIVETPAGDVDARMETRFEKIAQVLLPGVADEGGYAL